MPIGGTTWLQIDKDVPLPGPKSAQGRNNHTKAAVPWKMMEKGDSVFLANTSSAHVSRMIGQRRSRCMDDHVYTQRVVEGGVRVWRIA